MHSSTSAPNNIMLCCRVTIPAIFSISLPLISSFPDELLVIYRCVEGMINIFSDIEKKTRRLGIFDVKGIGYILSALEDYTSQKALILKTHLHFIKAYINYHYSSDKDKLAAFMKVPTEGQPDPSLYWYNVIAYYEFISRDSLYNNAQLAAMIDCCEKLPGTQKHGVFSIIMDCIHRFKTNEYLDASTLLRLQSLAPPGELVLEYSSLNIRHRFMQENLVLKFLNVQYFTAPETGFVQTLDQKEARSILISRLPSINARSFLPTTISDFKGNRYDFLRFVSHLSTISNAGIKLCNDELSSSDLKAYNDLNKRLQEHGFLNSEKVIIESKVFDKKFEGGVAQYSLKDDFANKCFDIMRSSFKWSVELTREKFEECFAAPIVTQHTHAKKHKQLLSRFNAVNALFLFRHLLITAHNNPRAVPTMNMLSNEKLFRAEDLLSTCMEHAFQAQAIMQNYLYRDSCTGHYKPLVTHHEHRRLFNASFKIIETLFASPKDMVIQIGTPILSRPDPKQKPFSEHAYYVCFKYRPEEHSFQIIIFNGGPGLSQHKKDPSINPSDLLDNGNAMYHPFTSVKFPINEENKTFFAHYLYKLFAQVYTFCENKEQSQEIGGNTYLGGFKNPSVEFTFEGFAGYKSTQRFVAEAPLPISYRGQITEICTIYNLKKALAFLTDMSLVEFGEFEDLLILNADLMLTQAFESLSAAATKISGGASIHAEEPGAGSTGWGISIDEEEAGSPTTSTAFFASESDALSPASDSESILEY